MCKKIYEEMNIRESSKINILNKINIFFFHWKKYDIFSDLSNIELSTFAKADFQLRNLHIHFIYLKFTHNFHMSFSNKKCKAF